MTKIWNTVFLGAGFSKWCCDLPLVSQLFDFDVSVGSDRERKRIERLNRLYDEWVSASRSDNAEQFIEAMHASDDHTTLTNWYITRRLTEPFVKRFSRRFTWYINSYHATSHEGIGAAADFLRHSTSRPNSAILTTNYDMIVEYALSSRGFNYGVEGEQIGFSPYPYPRPVYVTGPTPLLKLHGSVSWSNNSKFPDSRCGLNGKCVIVPPRAYKRPKEIFPNVWQHAEQILQKTRRTIFFGFAFNEYDEEIMELLINGLADSEKILLIDIVDQRPRLQNLFPNVEFFYMDALKHFSLSKIFRFVF